MDIFMGLYQNLLDLFAFCGRSILTNEDEPI